MHPSPFMFLLGKGVGILAFSIIKQAVTVGIELLDGPLSHFPGRFVPASGMPAQASSEITSLLW